MTWNELKAMMEQAGVTENAEVYINSHDVEGWDLNGATVEFTDDESGPCVEIKLL
jgi:hypothetical protein